MRVEEGDWVLFAIEDGQFQGKVLSVDQVGGWVEVSFWVVDDEEKARLENYIVSFDEIAAKQVGRIKKKWVTDL